MDNQPTPQVPRFGSTRRTAKVTIGSLSAGWPAVTVQQALDEVARELSVRERLYVRWVEEGKHTDTDARDRLTRMIKTAAILQSLADDEGLRNLVQMHLNETLAEADDGETATPVPSGTPDPY